MSKTLISHKFTNNTPRQGVSETIEQKNTFLGQTKDICFFMLSGLIRRQVMGININSRVRRTDKEQVANKSDYKKLIITKIKD